MSTSNLEIKIKALIEGLDSIAKLTSAITDVRKSTESLVGSSQSAGAAVTSLNSNLSSAGSDLTEVAASAEKLSTSLESVATGAESLAVSTAGVSSAVTESATAISDLAVGAADSASSLEDMASASSDAASGISAIAENSAASESRINTLSTLFGKVSDAMGDLAGGASEAGDSLEGSGEQGTDFGSVLQSLFDQATEAGSGFGDLGATLKGLMNPATAGASALSLVTSAAKALMAPLLALAGIKLTFDYLKDAAVYAGGVQTLGTTLSVVGQNAGYSKGELSGYEKQLKSTGISTEAARNSMIQMMQAGLGLGTQLGQTTPQVVQLARAAQDLAVVTGENSSDTMQRLITNIQQMDTMGMRFMGLSVDMTAAQQKFASSIGTTAGALTDAQKRQAVLNEAMVQAQKLAGSYEAAMEDVGKKVTSLKRYSEELSLAMGSKMLPLYGALVDSAGDLLKSLQKQAEAYDTTGAIGKEFGDGLASVLSPLTPIFTDIFTWIMNIGGAFGPVFKAAGAAVGAVLDVVATFFDLVSVGTGDLTLFQNAIEYCGFGLSVLADILTVVKMGIQFLVLGITQVIKSTASMAASIADFLGLPDSVVEKLKGISKAADDMGNKTAQSLDKSITKIKEGDFATKEWADSFFGLNEAAQKVHPATVDKYIEDIRLLTKAQNENTLTSIQVAAGHTKIKSSMDRALASNQLTQKEYDRLNVKLGAVAYKVKDELDAAFKQLGVTSSSLASGISEDTSVIIGALGKVADNGVATAEQFAGAFAEKVTMAGSIEELNAFSDVLAQAKTRWPDSLDTFKQAQVAVAAQFDDIYAKQLKTVTTTAQWEDLKKAVVAMGDSGTISQNKLNEALLQGEQQIARISPAFVAAADASKKLGDAITGVDSQIKNLGDAINVTAQKAEQNYANMASGYQTLSAGVAASTQEQIAAIDTRYNAEALLIEKNVMDVDAAEQQKLALLLSTEEDKNLAAELSYQKIEQYQEKEADAVRAALDVKLKALDDESAKVESAMNQQGANREEYDRKLKDLDEQRKQAVYEVETSISQKKVDNLVALRNRYVAYIDKLNSEEERHLGIVKSIQDQIAQSKMSAEERIRSIQIGAMSDYDAYQANLTDVATYQAKAREAAARGDYDAMNQYLSMAQSAASALNTTVKDGDKVYVDGKTGAANAVKALMDIEATRTGLLESEKSVHESLAKAAHDQAESQKTDLDVVTNKLTTLQNTAAQGATINITANADAATQKVTELDQLISTKNRLVPIAVDLKDADLEIKRLMASIEQGRTSKVDVDVTAANIALTQLHEFANQTANPKLAMDATQALAAIEDTKQKVQALDSVQASPKVTIESNAAEVKTEVSEVVTQAPDVTNKVAIDTNVTDVKEPLKEVTTQKDVTNKVDIATNATEVQPAITEATKARPDVQAQVIISTNADAVSATIQSLNGLVTRSIHQVATNVQAAMSQIWSLQGQNTSSYHTIYVVRQFLFAEGGDVGGFGSGQAAGAPHLSQGTIGGAGNTDSEARTLDAGSFVLRKSAVQKHGAGNLLRMIESAKNLPKVASAAVGRVRAMLMPGEIVVGKDVVSRLGNGFLSALNGGSLPQVAPLHFATGGPVGSVPDFGSALLSIGGSAMGAGTPVGGSGDTMQVDLRSDNSRATVSVQKDNSGNLLNLLADLKLRS